MALKNASFLYVFFKLPSVGLKRTFIPSMGLCLFSTLNDVKWHEICFHKVWFVSRINEFLEHILYCTVLYCTMMLSKYLLRSKYVLL